MLSFAEGANCYIVTNSYPKDLTSSIIMVDVYYPIAEWLNEISFNFEFEFLRSISLVVGKRIYSKLPIVPTIININNLYISLNTSGRL